MFLVFGLIGIIWLILSDYSLTQLIQDPESIPYLLRFFLTTGIASSMLLTAVFARLSIKRKQVPKDYYIEEDYQPNIFQSIRIYWTAAITGRKSMAKKPATMPLWYTKIPRSQQEREREASLN